MAESLRNAVDERSKQAFFYPLMINQKAVLCYSASFFNHATFTPLWLRFHRYSHQKHLLPKVFYFKAVDIHASQNNQVKISLQVKIWIEFWEKALPAWCYSCACRDQHPSHCLLRNLSNFKMWPFGILRIIVEILYVLLLQSDKEPNLNPAMLSCLGADYVSPHLCTNARTNNKQTLAWEKRRFTVCSQKRYQLNSLLRISWWRIQFCFYCQTGNTEISISMHSC